MAATCTVKILNGRNLRSADFFGKSDPYVIVEIPNKPKSKKKTEHISRTLNPDWNVDFEIDGFNFGDTLTFLVMDYDLLSDDDFLGSARIEGGALHSGRAYPWTQTLTMTNEGKPEQDNVTGHIEVEINVVQDRDPHEDIPQQLTAEDPEFPNFVDVDDFSICFNLREGDCDGEVVPDPFFHWHACFFELELGFEGFGLPKSETARKKVDDIGKKAALVKMKEVITENTKEDYRVFWAAGKARRWSEVKGPDGEKPTTDELLLVKKAGEGWSLLEVAGDTGEVAQQQPLRRKMLRRITYPFFALDDGAQAQAAHPQYKNDPSEDAWLDGCTVIRRAATMTGEAASKRSLRALPSNCQKVRWVPLFSRTQFLHTIASVPTVVVTGATLSKGDAFASPQSTDINTRIGDALGSVATPLNIHLMASGSMRAHHVAMSADNDLTTGFQRHRGCHSVHFKGSNAVRLHGYLWRMSHGISYVLQEDAADFSNIAKQACLAACCTNQSSLALCANGGKSAAGNVVQYLALCRPGRVFTISAVHGQGGMSGAAESFDLSENDLENHFTNLGNMAPDFFSGLVTTKRKEIIDVLQQRPLRLLDVHEGGCQERPFIVRPGHPNKTKSPGFGDQEPVQKYAYEAINVIGGNKLFEKKAFVIPAALTAENELFPQFLDKESSICFNLRCGDIARYVDGADPFFHWHGSYFELESGEPKGEDWKANVETIGTKEGLDRVNAVCSAHTGKKDRLFWAPGKARVWKGLQGPYGERPTDSDLVLVKRSDGSWYLLEVTKDGKMEKYNLPLEALRRITYSMLALKNEFEPKETGQKVERQYNDLSELAWLDGCTLIRYADKCKTFDPSERTLDDLPRNCQPVRWVSLALREEFLKKVASEPTIVVTGATLNRSDQWGSPLSTELNEEVGSVLGSKAASLKIKLMASGSKRVHFGTMSADNDLTAGFVRHEGSGCAAIHFKGSNAVRLHGDIWSVGHGKSYVLEEAVDDFSNTARDACLMAACTNQGSMALCANGGPTVARQLVSFLALCPRDKVFSLCGTHSQKGTSGAAANEPLSEQKLAEIFSSMRDLGSFFATQLGTSAKDMLKQKPLRLLDIDRERGCQDIEFELVPGKGNDTKYYGLLFEGKPAIPTYARAVVEEMHKSKPPRGHFHEPVPPGRPVPPPAPQPGFFARCCGPSQASSRVAAAA